ncbi:MAG: inorganic diphosphatase [Nanoarchaeota archaeon]|nr:inorganic diphosphatase [Nanoarchaeota archaeon]MBU4117005.1 inorganic diphosphatase [Nanoarchaeota archaeon]
MIDINKISPGEKCPEIINVLIEIPKGSSNKYELDKETGLLFLDRPLYSSVHYPGDYGLIPQTHWDDGDPLDVLVITSTPVYPLTLAEVRVIGVLRMIDSGEKDDKIIGVYNSEPRFKEVKDIKDIPKHTIKEIINFFETYKELQGKKCEITEVKGRETAYKDVERGIKAYKKKIEKE